VVTLFAAALLFSCVVVAISSAINLPNHPPKFPVPQNNTAFGLNGYESAAPVAASAIQRNQTLTFAERVAYQRAIEEVYWRHRIWPRENAKPKPSLDEVMSVEQIEKKVEDYLRDSQALETYWQKPIAPEQLQAEMERMARNTKQPEVLLELFEALGNDPSVIAECLARPVLTERLIRDLTNGRDPAIAGGRPSLSARSAVAPYQNAATLGTAAYLLPEISNPDGCIDDTWTATSTTNAPSARAGHTAVWTGSEMIVWGGAFGFPNYLNTGGKYNPTTDSWTATSTTNAPSARVGHTAVWTGSEMIVWGGYNLGVFNTGGRYNPSTDSWTATSTTNAPSARAGHTAVWIGSEMIVWGGAAGTNGFSTGGRYNPGTDSWTATSTTSVPAGRFDHTAVWTGSEMIVWGGVAFEDYLNTGGRYNPGTDSWTATSTTNVPSARYGHTAVWTGSEMIIWGGLFTNTGGRYNPGTDSWIATSTANAPSPRQYHTAVWTGSEMIVWGGADYDGGPPHYFNTGGRYCAQSGSPTPTPTATATATATPTATPRLSPTPRPHPSPQPRP
jgi:N-acetylneuraminic acid mutarotase